MTEKELILTAILKCDRSDLYCKPISLNSQQKILYHSILQRRQQGEPLQYLLGETEFMGMPIAVNPHVLIPRPETEIFVDHIVKEMKDFSLGSEFCRILELGTGSGNIAISLAKLIPHSRIKTVDVSADALVVAKLNAGRNKVDSVIEFFHDDMKTFIPAAIKQKQCYHLIVSNPPYIPSSDISKLPRDVQCEPLLALDGGSDGLDFYRFLIRECPSILLSGGYLGMEIGDGQKQGIKKIFEVGEDFCEIDFVQDFSNADRIVWAKRK